MQRNMEQEIIPRWIPVHHYFMGLVRYLKGDREAYRDVGNAIDHMIECRYLLRIGMYIAGLARVLLHRGLIDEASDTIALAFQFQEQQESVGAAAIDARRCRHSGTGPEITL